MSKRIRVTPRLIARVLASWVDEETTPEEIASKPPCSGCDWQGARKGDHRSPCILDETRAAMRHLLRAAATKRTRKKAGE